MSGELRAQERQPCEWPGWGAAEWCYPTDHNPACEGCDGRGRGTRWVVVGTLVPRGTTVVPSATSNGYEHEPRYTIEPVGTSGAHDAT